MMSQSTNVISRIRILQNKELSSPKHIIKQKKLGRYENSLSCTWVSSTIDVENAWPLLSLPLFMSLIAELSQELLRKSSVWSWLPLIAFWRWWRELLTTSMLLFSSSAIGGIWLEPKEWPDMFIWLPIRVDG